MEDLTSSELALLASVTSSTATQVDTAFPSRTTTQIQLLKLWAAYIAAHPNTGPQG